MRRNQLVLGVVLLLIGGLMLANAMGIKLPNGMSLMELFWPFVLILGGGSGFWLACSFAEVPMLKLCPLNYKALQLWISISVMVQVN